MNTWEKGSSDNEYIYTAHFCIILLERNAICLGQLTVTFPYSTREFFTNDLYWSFLLQILSLWQSLVMCNCDCEPESGGESACENAVLIKGHIFIFPTG